MKMKKNLFCLASAVLAALAFCTPVFAGTWQEDVTGVWWRNDDGSYLKGGWQWIDTDGDGIARCYYFNEQGYAQLDGVTPDGYELAFDGAAGAWIQNGTYQTASANDVGAARLTEYNGYYGTTNEEGEAANSVVVASDASHPQKQVMVSFYRLMSADGFADVSEEGYLRMYFADPNGLPMAAYLWPQGDKYNLTITHSEWALLPEGTIFYGYRRY